MNPNLIYASAKERTDLQEIDLQQKLHLIKWPGLKFGLIAFAICFSLLMWIAAISYINYATQRQIEYTYRTNENLAAAYAEHTAQALKEIESLLRLISMEHRKPASRFSLQVALACQRFHKRLALTLILSRP